MNRMISLISLEFTRVIKRTNTFQNVLFRKPSEFSEFPYGKLYGKQILLRIKRFVHLDFTDFTFIHKCLAANCFDLVKSIFPDFTVSHCYKGCTIRNMLNRLFTIVPVDMSDMCRTYMNHVYQCISTHIHAMFNLFTNHFIARNRLKTLYIAHSGDLFDKCGTHMNHVHQCISNQIHGMFNLFSHYSIAWNSLKTLYIVLPVDMSGVFGICSNTTSQCTTYHLTTCPPCFSVMGEA